MTKAQQTREPRYRVFKGKGSRTPAFTTNWKFLADAYVSYRCPNYGRIEKLVSGQYKPFWKWLTESAIPTTKRHGSATCQKFEIF